MASDAHDASGEPRAGAPNAEAPSEAPAAGAAAEANDARRDLCEFLLSNVSASDPSTVTVAELREQRRLAANERKRLTKELRNETRKRERRLEKSAQLSTMDLVAVLEVRRERAAAKAVAKAKAAPHG